MKIHEQRQLNDIISAENGVEDWGFKNQSRKIRFTKKYKEDEDYFETKQRGPKSVQERQKIKEEAVHLRKCNFSIESNLSYRTGFTNSEAFTRKGNSEKYSFRRSVVEKDQFRKFEKETFQILTPKENSYKGYLSNQKFDLNKIQSRNTNKITGETMTEMIQNRRKFRKLIQVKTIENFGGIANFKFQNPSIKSNCFITKKQSNIKTRDKSYKKRKYRDKKTDSSSSSEEYIPGSSSAKARVFPRIWFGNKERRYYSKKSHLFENFNRKSSSGYREREVVRMFMNGKKVEKSVKMRNNSLMEKIRNKCQKIIQEPKSKDITKVQKFQSNENQYNSMHGLTSKIKNEIQTPSITSIDPIFIHAFMKRKMKRPKLKQGVAFFTAIFKSSRTEKKFYIYEDEKKVVKFPRKQKNKIIEHKLDDDYDTDDEQFKLAVRQCKFDFMKALKKVQKQFNKKKRALSMMSLAKKSNRNMINEKLMKLKNIHEKSKRRYKTTQNSRRQTRKNHLSGFHKGDSLISVASTVASSMRSTHKPKQSKERKRKMIKNEYYKADRNRRRAISRISSRGTQNSDIYSYFDKGCRKRNKIGF